MDEIWKYIIVGDNRMAIGVHSLLNYMEFKKYIKQMCTMHDGELVFRSGVDIFINPKIMLPEDFANYLPMLIEV